MTTAPRVLLAASSLILAATGVVHAVAFIAAQSSGAMRPVILALALMPAASAFLIYRFLGSFYAGHILLAAAVAALVAGLAVD